MATTTNYSWTTPDDTALVKDGAAAIRSLGTAIDTTVFNNASAAIAKTIVDAKGDIIAATAADTVSRLAVGTDGQVLTAASGQSTGLQWATPSSSALTLITTATAANTAVTLSVNDCFSTTYEDYFILCDIKTASDSSANFKLRVSSTDAITLYYSNGIDMTSTATTVTGKAQANDVNFDLGDWGTTAGAKALIVTNPFIAIDTGILMTGAGGWQGTKTNQRQQWGIHHASTSYTGFTITGQSNLTGTVRVYGYAK